MILIMQYIQLYESVFIKQGYRSEYGIAAKIFYRIDS